MTRDSDGRFLADSRTTILRCAAWFLNHPNCIGTTQVDGHFHRKCDVADALERYVSTCKESLQVGT